MTLFGKHTLDETRDLLAVADYRFKETGKAYDALPIKPIDIQRDWEILLPKWKADAKNIANILTIESVRNFPRPSSVIVTDKEYKRILDYIQFQENVPGSLQDITKRIEIVSNQPIMYEHQPGGKPNTDVDAELFKKLDSTTKEMDAAAKAAKEGAKDAAFSNLGLIIAGTAIVTIVGTQVLKRSL